VAKKELNLLQFAAGGTAEASATSTLAPALVAAAAEILRPL